MNEWEMSPADLHDALDKARITPLAVGCHIAQRKLIEHLNSQGLLCHSRTRDMTKCMDCCEACKILEHLQK